MALQIIEPLSLSPKEVEELIVFHLEYLLVRESTTGEPSFATPLALRSALVGSPVQSRGTSPLPAETGSSIGSPFIAGTPIFPAGPRLHPQGSRASLTGTSPVLSDASISPLPVVPSASVSSAVHSQLQHYVHRLVTYMRCPLECFVVALGLMYRLEQQKNLTPTTPSWGTTVTGESLRQLLLATSVVAIKMYSDVYEVNKYYAHVGGLPHHSLAKLEVEVYSTLDFCALVTPQAYQDIVHRGDPTLRCDFSECTPQEEEATNGLNEHSSEDSSTTTSPMVNVPLESLAMSKRVSVVSFSSPTGASLEELSVREDSSTCSAFERAAPGKIDPTLVVAT